ncbi:MAG: DUF1566 domain-containing protein, partial [Saprospiraceae bacterium]|nr:DUF1566 domain-containing protein [Saprospiraceae bacterium]
MTESERDAIASPATGLLIFQTDGTSGFYYYSGTAWTPIHTGTPAPGPCSISGTIVGSNVTVNGFSDGVVSLSYANATSPIVYQWSNGANTQTITGLSAGTYSATLTDANLCTFTASKTITEPPVVTPCPSIVCDLTVSASASFGTIAASGAEGTQPYSYQWDGLASHVNTSTATGISPGTYNVIVTDINGCTATASASWSCALALNASASLGTLTAIASGGVIPYSYLWDGSASGQITATVTGMPPGTYNVIVTDAYGCTATASASWSCALTASLNTSSGTISAIPSGGSMPYTYQWDASANSQTTATATGLTMGTPYQVTVTDVYGCTATASGSWSCAMTASITIPSGSSLSVSVVNGLAPYTYQWDASANGQTTATATGLTIGTPYQVTVTDVNGCTATATDIPLAIGETYQGGIIFWLDGNGGGLIAAPSDQSSLAEWGCYQIDVPGGEGSTIGTGLQNTMDIIFAGCTMPAYAPDICANLTLGGYSDWFLPSKDELNQMYLNLHMNNLGGFSNSTYWSSTEYSYGSAWGYSFYFGWGGAFDFNKTNLFNVRAIRAF